MIDFDEEVMKFQPCLEVSRTEEAIRNNDMTDFSDIIDTVIRNAQQSMVSEEYEDPYQ